MDLPDLKQLKKLADACRKAGIKTCSVNGITITLDESHVPEPSAYLKRKAKAEGKPITPPKQFIQGTSIPVDTMSSEDLLFLSCGGPPDGFDPSEDLPS